MSENLELYEKIVSVSRNTKVVKGGRRFSFGVIVVVGDRKGRVGVGLGKATEVMDAKVKASSAAKKSMFKVPLREGRTIHHDITAKFGPGKVILRTAPQGTGIIAGGSVRAIFEAIGIKDVVAKSLGSSNPHNVVKATLSALRQISSPKQIAERRTLKIGEIISRREGSAKSEAVVSVESDEAPKAKKIKK